MRDFISSRVLSIASSPLSEFLTLTQGVKNIISLGIGEPDFVTPYHIREEMIDSLLDGQTQYTDSRGIQPLREAIAAYLKERHDLCYDPNSEIIVTIGASEAIDLVFRTVLEEGDEVLLPDPGYISYEPCVRLSGGVPVPVATDNTFQLTGQALEECVTPRSKVLVLSYPNNPTGAVLDDEHLQQIVDVCKRHNLLVISDEIYNELVYDGVRQRSVAALPGMRERTATLNGFSKAFAMTGQRIGYVAAPEYLTAAFSKVHTNTILCASRTSQMGALAALVEGQRTDYQEVAKMRDSYDARRRLMVHAFSEMGLECYEPKGAFYMFPSIKSTGLSSREFCKRLLEEEGVVCIPGHAFGKMGEGHIRCCYATAHERLMEAFSRMRAFLERLRSQSCSNDC